MNRRGIIKLAIEALGYASYLELGCEENDTFSKIRIGRKVGVDSKKGGTHRMTTDEFFLQNEETFDIVFIDACHHHDQVLKDFRSSLAVLNPGGLIVLHDCNPIDRDHESQELCGTAWRAFVRHVRTDPELDSICCDFDHGVGLVRRGPNRAPLALDTSMDDLTYGDLVDHRNEWLQLWSGEEVRAWLTNRVGG